MPRKLSFADLTAKAEAARARGDDVMAATWTERAKAVATPAELASMEPKPKRAARKGKVTAQAVAGNSGSAGPRGKVAVLLGLLGRDEGASMDEMTAALGWQRSSVSGAFNLDVKRWHAAGVRREGDRYKLA